MNTRPTTTPEGTTMRLTAPTSARQLDLGLTILRVVTGIIFAAHGAQKIFVMGLDGVAGGFGQTGIPMAGLLGPLVALGEFFGGLALVAGLLTRVAGLGLAAIMLGATLIAHRAAGFFMPSGYEFTLTLLAASLALAFTGAGRWSLDGLVEKKAVSRGPGNR
jgi:putative oxidoreductase